MCPANLLLVLWTVLLPGAITKTSLRIIGGRDATSGEYPFAVRLEILQTRITPNKKTSWINLHCTGSALTTTWTISAAHCAEPIDEIIQTNYTNRNRIMKPIVRYGNPHMKPSENKKHSVILRTEYPHQRMDTIPGDISLLYTEPIVVEKYAKLSAFDYNSLIGQEVTMIGFGFMQGNYTDGYKHTLDLDKPLQIIDRALLMNCGDMNFASNYLCAVPKCGEIQTAYSGDSGSPVIHASGVVGVHSAGSSGFLFKSHGGVWKNMKGQLNIISPVSVYLDWIHSFVADEDKIISKKK